MRRRRGGDAADLVAGGDARAGARRPARARRAGRRPAPPRARARRRRRRRASTRPASGARTGAPRRDVDVGAEVQRRRPAEAGRAVREPHLPPAADGHGARLPTAGVRRRAGGERCVERGHGAVVRPRAGRRPPRPGRRRRRAAAPRAPRRPATARSRRPRGRRRSPRPDGPPRRRARSPSRRRSSSRCAAFSGERRAWWEPRERADGGAREHERPERLRLGLRQRQLGVEAGEHVERDPQRLAADRGRSAAAAALAGSPIRHVRTTSPKSISPSGTGAGPAGPTVL